MKHSTISVFFVFLFSVLSIAIVSAKDDYQLQYYPCATSTASVTYNQLSQFVSHEVSNGNISVVYDVPGMGKKGDTAGAYFVFLLNDQAIALFNCDRKSYIVTGHKRLPKKVNDHDSFSFAYADILYPEIFLKGGEALTFEQIEKMLEAKIIPLTQKNMKSVLIVTKIIPENIAEIVEKPVPKPAVKIITVTTKN